MRASISRTGGHEKFEVGRNVAYATGDELLMPEDQTSLQFGHVKQPYCSVRAVKNSHDLKLETFIRKRHQNANARPASWRRSSRHRYRTEKLRHCYPIVLAMCICVFNIWLSAFRFIISGCLHFSMHGIYSQFTRARLDSTRQSSCVASGGENWL